MKNILLLLLLSINLLQSCKTAESTAKTYAKLISKGKCEDAISVTTGEARNKLINNECNAFGKSQFKNMYCETGKTSATCKYIEKSVFYNLETEMETTLKLVKLNKDWKITKVNSTVNYINGNNDPVAVTKYFIKLMANANYDFAELLTENKAKNIISTYKLENNTPYYSKVLSVENKIETDNKIIIKTIENRGKYKNLIFFYHLKKENSSWKIILFNKTYPKEAHDVTTEFVTAMADGNCVFALELSTGKAKDYVVSSQNAGCIPYPNKIVSEPICDYKYDGTAECYCVENRDIYGDLTFHYSLKKVDGDWKVSAFSKDEIDE